MYYVVQTDYEWENFEEIWGCRKENFHGVKVYKAGKLGEEEWKYKHPFNKFK